MSFSDPGLPAELQQQLDAIIDLCYRDCSHESDPLTAVNAVTRQLPTRIQAVIDHVQRIVSADGDIRASPLPWILLGKLVRHLNGHFRVRPRVMFGQDGEDAQATAEAVRSIVAAVKMLIQTLSMEDEREENLSTFRIVTMETEDDIEMAARFVFLDRISKRVVAHKPANQRWVVEVDGAQVQHACDCDDTPSGSRDLPSPMARYSKPEQQDDLDSACSACLLPLFAFNEDGTAPIRHWRRLLCPTVWGVTDRTPKGHVHKHVLHDHCAQQWFVVNQKNVCPSCKHDFSDMLFLDITSALQHEVVDGVAQWSEAATAARRLGALQALTHLPQEQPLGLSIARAIVLSLADADQGIVCAAARSISHWADALYIFMQEPAFCRLLCETSVAALRSAASDDTKAVISTAISDLVLNEDGRRALVAADACQAVADALRSAASDDARITISVAYSLLVKRTVGVLSL